MNRNRLASMVIALAVLVVAHQAAAAVFEVTTTEDGDDGSCDDHCTLREAVRAANAWPGLDTVRLAAGTYHLTLPGSDEDAAETGDLDVTDGLVIEGAGARHCVIDGGHLDRVLDVRSSGALELSRVTIRGGQVAGSGGGVRAGGDLTVIACSILDNTTTGFGFGGGLAGGPGLLIIERSTIAGNSADGGGGGVVVAGFADLDNVTLSDNESVADLAGAIYLFSGGTAQLNNVTVVGNRATWGGGVLAEGGSTFEIGNSIVAGNSAPLRPDCSGTFDSWGHNLVGIGTDCSGFGGPGDLLGAAGAPLDPVLGVLGAWGGETDTHEPLAGSPAIDAGSAEPPSGTFGSCETVDQRLGSRPFDGDGEDGPRCDIGAHEAGIVFTDGAETGDLNRWSDFFG